MHLIFLFARARTLTSWLLPSYILSITQVIQRSSNNLEFMYQGQWRQWHPCAVIVVLVPMGHSLGGENGDAWCPVVAAAAAAAAASRSDIF